MNIRILSVLCILFFYSGNIIWAREYKISSAAELTALQLNAGDKVILKDVAWKDQRLVFKGNGNEKAPIVLTTERPGEIKLTGNSTLLIDGTWLVVDGLFFTEGYSDKKDVIVFSEQSSYCRLTNTAVVNFNHPDKTVDYKWVSVYGHRNRVDYCWLEGKTHQGTTLVVWLDDQPNYDQIDHNYFGQRPDLGVNGGETIRIGNSTWSLHDSYTTVEKNIFKHCDGELEIISNKSCKNMIRDNLFYESKGTLTLRHGNDADVYGNIFIGNGVPNTGGIRVIAENHKVHDNYLQDLAGTGMSAAISIMDGLPNPPLTGHWQVKNAKIYNNMIIDCKASICIGVGKNEQRYLKAENTSITGNIIVPQGQAIHWVDDSVKIQFANNIMSNVSAEKLPAGFSVKDLILQKDPIGLYRISGQPGFTAFWKKESIGPNWRKEQPNIAIR